MARDYDAELAALEAKKKRIQKAKTAHEQRHYGPAGKDAIAQFPQLTDMGVKERRAFFAHLAELLDAENAEIENDLDARHEYRATMPGDAE